MENHYHLLVSPVDDDGTLISRFAKKLGMGYAKYFNEKHKRTGALWQGRYKKILIQRDVHYQYIPYYIHLNPLDYSYPSWREGSVTKTRDALDVLTQYRWSSFLDYWGTPNFPSIIYTSLLRLDLGSQNMQRKQITDIITSSSLASSSTILE
jgi:putative transposase